MNDTTEKFKKAMADAGYAPPDTIAYDKFHRFKTDKRGKNGWCVLHDAGNMAIGTFGDWATDFQSTWCSVERATFTSTQRAEYAAAQKAAIELANAELKASQDAVAKQAHAIWNIATPAVHHDYLKAKGVQAYGTRVIDADVARQHCEHLSSVLTGMLLVVPMRKGSELRSLQFITTDGTKRPLTGGEKRGCYFAIGKGLTRRVAIAEGFATSASVHEATASSVAVAFDRGNMGHVAKSLHADHPNHEIVLCADDDFQKEGNPGLKDAREAAKAIGGWLAVPDFTGYDRGEGTDFNDLRAVAGLEAVKVCIDNATQVIQANCEWQKPIDITSDLPPAPEFDASVLLPKSLADFVLDEADRMPCSPDYVAATLIVCLGSVIGAKCGLKPKRRDDWIVVPNLWGGIVGDPSSKKTPALGTVTRFLDRLEAKESEKLEQAKVLFEAETAAFEASQSAVKAAMKKAAVGKPDALKMASAIADMQSIQPPTEPFARRYKSNDSSIEKLADILSRNPQGIMVFRDELTGLLASWEREGHEGDRAFYLEGWNGTGSYNSDRIGRGEQYVKNLCLSIFGGIQPDKIESYLSDIASNLDNDGRVQRFQVMVYPDPVPWEWRDRYPVKGAREAVRDTFDRLASFDPVQDGATPADDFVKLPNFGFDDEAQDIFIQWCTELNHVHVKNETDPLMRQHWGKFEKLFCSIALILHLAEGNIGQVKVDSAFRAAAWCEYLAGHARRIYGMVECSKVSTAKMIGRRIVEGKLKSGFTVRDVARKCWTGVKTNLQVESALMILEEHHWLQAYESDNSTGRPTTHYAVNPALIGG